MLWKHMFIILIIIIKCVCTIFHTIYFKMRKNIIVCLVYVFFFFFNKKNWVFSEMNSKINIYLFSPTTRTLLAHPRDPPCSSHLPLCSSKLNTTIPHIKLTQPTTQQQWKKTVCKRGHKKNKKIKNKKKIKKIKNKK